MPEKTRKLSRSEKFNNVAKLFWLYFWAPETKSTSQARIKPEIFLNFRSELGPTYNSARTKIKYLLQKSIAFRTTRTAIRVIRRYVIARQNSYDMNQLSLP